MSIKGKEMPVQKLKDYLDQHEVEYVTISHSPAYTAQRIAEVSHIPGKELAKTVIVKIDDKYAMAVLPASRRVDLRHLQEAIRVMRVTATGAIAFVWMLYLAPSILSVFMKPTRPSFAAP